MAAPNALRVKVNNKGDTRLWRTAREDDYEGLLAFIVASWKSRDFIAQYKDDEEDLITITSARDLKDAFDSARAEGLKSLKIWVEANVLRKQRQRTPPAQSAQNAEEKEAADGDSEGFSSLRAMVEDFLTDDAILGALPLLVSAFVAKMSAEGKRLSAEELAAMLVAEIESERYRVITEHELYRRFGAMAVPCVSRKMAAMQSLFPHFRSETIQQWVHQLVAILQGALSSTNGGCSFSDIVLDIEYPAVTDTGKVIHFGVECNVCGEYPIIGDRYKCSICEDWDCCARCEPQHDDHPLIKFKRASKEHKDASFKGLSEIVGRLSGGVAAMDIAVGGGRAPQCVCGRRMESVRGVSAYGGSSEVFCDCCDRRCSGALSTIWHCPNGKDVEHHEAGYDLCTKCGADRVAEEDRVSEEPLEEPQEAPAEEPAEEQPAAEQKEEAVEMEDAVVVEVEVEPEPEPEPVAEPMSEEEEQFEFASQLREVQQIMAFDDGDSLERVRALLVQHKGDIAKVVPLLLE